MDGTPMFVAEDLCKVDYDKKKTVRPVMLQAYKRGDKPVFKNGTLYINGREFRN